MIYLIHWKKGDGVFNSLLQFLRFPNKRTEGVKSTKYKSSNDNDHVCINRLSPIRISEKKSHMNQILNTLL